MAANLTRERLAELRRKAGSLRALVNPRTAEGRLAAYRLAQVQAQVTGTRGPAPLLPTEARDIEALRETGAAAYKALVVATDRLDELVQSPTLRLGERYSPEQIRAYIAEVRALSEDLKEAHRGLLTHAKSVARSMKARRQGES